MLLNQLRSCQGKPSATKMDDFFMVGGSKNKIAIFLCMGPIFGQKNTKRPPPQKKEKEKKKEDKFNIFVGNQQYVNAK